jgi:hypothetical protein
MDQLVEANILEKRAVSILSLEDGNCRLLQNEACYVQHLKLLNPEEHHHSHDLIQCTTSAFA